MSDERIVSHALSDRPKGNTDWARVDALSDDEIAEAIRTDPDAAPIADEKFWRRAVPVGPHSQEQIDLSVDSDVVDWFRTQGQDYKALMNAALRRVMESGKGGLAR